MVCNGKRRQDWRVGASREALWQESRLIRRACEYSMPGRPTQVDRFERSSGAAIPMMQSHEGKSAMDLDASANSDTIKNLLRTRSTSRNDATKNP